MINNFSQLNGGWGFYVQAAAPAGGSLSILAMFPWFYPVTFANNGGGVYAAGAAPPASPPSPPPYENPSPAPLNNFAVIGGIFAQDNNHEIWVNTYGLGVRILDTLATLAGTYNGCGPLANLGPLNAGHGLYSTNNIDITITGSSFVQNSWSGINLSGDSKTLDQTEAVITGCRVTDNNAKFTYTPPPPSSPPPPPPTLSISPNSNYNGIDIESSSTTPPIIASCVISGCRIGCQSYITPYPFQNYSVYAIYGSNVLVDGCNLKNHHISATGSTSGTIVVGTNFT